MEAITDASGAVSHFNTVKSPIFGAAEQVERIVAVARPIRDPTLLARSDKDRRERKESLSELRAFVSNIPLATAMLDMKSRILSHSNAWLTLFGIEPPVIESFFDEVFEPRLPLSDAIAEVAAQGREREFESLTFVNFQGKKMTVSVKISPWSMPTRGVGGSIVLIQDISDRIKAYKALRESVARYEAAVTGSNDGIWDWDIVNDVVFYAERFKNLLGFFGEEVPARFEAWASRIHPEDKDRTLTVLQEHLDHRKPYDVLYRLKRKNGDYRWFRAKGQAIWDENGAPVRMAGAISDIHDMKQMEDELRRSNFELEQFAYVASHDLQAPLRHVAAFSEILMEACGEDAREDVRESVERITGATRRMQRLISDLLAFSRVGKRKMALESTDMGDLAKQTRELLETDLASLGGSIHIGALPIQRVDPVQISQLFQNLFQNAVKFRAKHRPPLIAVSAEKTANGWRYCVADNGIGIHPDHRERIFGVFQRLHLSDEVEGTGIGLSICRKIAVAHDGAIWVESEPDKGSRFFFEIPNAL